jgi:hypothetical protein
MAVAASGDDDDDDGGPIRAWAQILLSLKPI